MSETLNNKRILWSFKIRISKFKIFAGMPLVKTIGIVIFRRRPHGCEYLLLHHRGPYWNFPKGRVEPRDEGELGTAFRELAEESGLPRAAVRLMPGFRTTYRYHFRGRDADGQLESVSKLAIFYLGEVVRAQPVVISHEHRGAGWFDAREAWERLHYPNSRRVLGAAEAFLQRRLPTSKRRPVDAAGLRGKVGAARQI